jgi:hypothetical protein
MENDLSGQKDRNNRTLLIGQSNQATKQKKFMICELCLCVHHHIFTLIEPMWL